ncbi:glycoside hydrolase family 43 protein [Aurantiacibacter sp. MUD61]|uniref:glycoside hydrolase family 43 protein n=1 Tax=Aurantiacibacter sp. MUD61 TaxID=3009083 RepID=UPI0022F02C05|nr:glycoside hydrolase family 43 protein [Aurantiacibacter sp. MUD61]
MTSKAALATLSVALFCTPASAQADPAPTASFAYLEYSAQEEEPATPPGTFRNRVLPGFHPDPSMVKVGDDFYAVTSTFSWFPGLPIFHSRDLVNWRQIGNAFDRTGQVDFSGLGINRGLFAPAITHDGERFWIANTCIDCGSNFVITADDPAGPWSDPVWLDFGGIDPSLYFEGDRAWIVYNDAPPGEPLYEGHRALWLQELDLETMQMAPERTLLVNGGVDLSAEPVWAEGPHIYKVDGWYYLLTAEGGTADQHSQTIYRSRDLAGPYVPGPLNPILTQRNMPADRPDRVEATGHADFVQLDDGSWWGLFLATRPFAEQSTLMGRETFLLPVTWEDGWPYFLQPGEPVPATPRQPDLADGSGTDWRNWRDDFDARELGPEWLSIRTPSPVQSTHLAEGAFHLVPAADGAASFGNPAFAGRRLRHHAAQFETQIDFEPGENGQRAGLLAFMDEGHFLTATIERSENARAVVVRRRSEEGDPEAGEEMARLTLSAAGPVGLRIRFDGGTAHVSAQQAGNDWQEVGGPIDVEPLASVYAGLFTGVVVGPYAVTSE